MTIKQRIASYLQNLHEGIDDDELAGVLNLKSRQQANQRCHELEREGFVIRKKVNGKIHNFWAENPLPAPTPAQVVVEPTASKFELWFWEGNVQLKVVEFLAAQKYQIRSVADTATYQRGIDIVAEGDGKELWVTVKGYPKGTDRTNPSLQASHWFKQVIFDVIEYRQRDRDVSIAVALPDYPRYRGMSKKITWLQPVANFYYLWVNETGEITVE
jgi:hypothetical protein